MLGDVYVGIDPQPDNISVCAIETTNGDVLYWHKHKLKLKLTFNRAEDWQRYIVEESLIVLDKMFSKFRLSLANNVYISIEQQRGRVNSIVEQTLFTLCVTKGYQTFTTGPMLWKKMTDTKSVGENKKNKQKSVDMVLHIYENYIDSKVGPKFRAHDLCDAYLIAWALLISKSSARNKHYKQLLQKKCRATNQMVS